MKPRGIRYVKQEGIVELSVKKWWDGDTIDKKEDNRVGGKGAAHRGLQRAIVYLFEWFPGD